MSDSEWESDSDDEGQSNATAAVTTTSTASQPAATTSTGAAPGRAAAPVASAAPPSVLLALPIQLSMPAHPALAGGIPAGVTLLYDAAKSVITLLSYDQHKRPMLVESLDGSRYAKPSPLPLSLSLGDGEGGGALHVASAADNAGRKWTMAFASPAEAARLVAHVAAATLVAKAAASLPVAQLFVRHDLARGSGKSCKPHLFASVQVRAWLLSLTGAEAGSVGAASIACVGGATDWTTFNPDLAVGAASASGAVPFTQPFLVASVADVEVGEEAAGSNAPSSLGEALAGGGKLKTDGGSRLLALPAFGPLARSLAASQGISLPRGGEGQILLLQLTPLSVSKKKSEKKERGKKKTEKDITVLPSPAATDDEPVLVSNSDIESPAAAASAAAAAESALSPALSSSASSSSSHAHGPSPLASWSAELRASLAPLLPALQSFGDHLSSVPPAQVKLVKQAGAELYEGLVADLGLSAAAEAQQSGAEVDPAQAAQLAALQSRVRALVSSFQEKNSAATTRGTLASMLGAWKGTLLPTMQPLLSPEGLLSDAKLQALQAASASASAAADADRLRAQLAKLQSAHAAELKKLHDSHRTLQSQLDEQQKSFASLQSKHNSLVMAHVDLEEKAASLEKSSGELKQKAEMCAVFESGLTDLRRLFEAECEKSAGLEADLADLLTLQSKHKLTWVPDAAATHCMACRSAFSRFGSKSKGRCRYCGRAFCRDCTTQSTLPELGYSSKVKVCKPCAAFRNKLQDEQSQAAADDDDEEE